MTLDEKIEVFSDNAVKLKSTVVSYLLNSNKGEKAANFKNLIYTLRSQLNDIEDDVKKLTGDQPWNR